MAPAIRIARAGFPVYARLNDSINRRQEALKRWPASTKLYLVDGVVPAVGSVWRNPDIANSLELIVSQGKKGFYEGEFAARLGS